MPKEQKETVEEWSARREETLETVLNLRLMDDILMTVALKDDTEAVQCILRIILGDEKLKVVRVIVQDVNPNLYGRGVRLDVHAIDGDGRHFDIEIQRASSGIDPRRTRHNGALMDTENVPKGGNPANLPDTFVIFICEQDPYKMGRPVYSFRMRMDESLEPHNDGMHYVYFNGKYSGNDDYGKLAQDLQAKEPEDIHFPALADAVRRAKHTEKGVSSMCQIYEEYGDRRYNEGREEGREKGREEGREEGIRIYVKALNRFQQNREDAIKNVGLEFGLTEQAAEEKVSLYWDT